MNNLIRAVLMTCGIVACIRLELDAYFGQIDLIKQTIHMVCATIDFLIVFNLGEKNGRTF